MNFFSPITVFATNWHCSFSTNSFSLQSICRDTAVLGMAFQLSLLLYSLSEIQPQEQDWFSIFLHLDHRVAVVLYKASPASNGNKSNRKRRLCHGMKEYKNHVNKRRMRFHWPRHSTYRQSY